MYWMYVCIGSRCVLDVGVYIGMCWVYVPIGCRYACSALSVDVGMYIV